jgi:hypothetical protein
MVAKVPSFEFFQNIFSYSDSTHLKTYPQKFSSKTLNVYIKNVKKNLGSIYTPNPLSIFILKESKGKAAALKAPKINKEELKQNVFY